MTIIQIAVAPGEQADWVYGLDEGGDLHIAYVRFPNGRPETEGFRPLIQREPAKPLEAQGYLHVDGEDFRNLTTTLGYIEQMTEGAQQPGADLPGRLADIRKEAAAMRDRLAAIRKGARTA